MEGNPTQLAPANVTEAESKLVEFVRGNRQQPPPMPARIETTPLAFTPASAATIAAREAKQAKRAEALRRAEIQQRGAELLHSAGQRYRWCSLDNFHSDLPPQKKIISVLREYIDGNYGCGIVLYGPVGTGKDHLAFAVCREAIKGGKTAKWINGQTWFGLVRDSIDTDKSEASLIAELTRVDLLCLSDPLPPVGSLTQHQATMLYRVVDSRYSRALPTICTVNVASDEEADSRMGAATWDRLTHDAWKLKCAWPTYRQPARDI